MKKIQKIFPPKLIFNSYETPLLISRQNIYTTARKGQYTPHTYVQPGQKETIRAITTVSGDGQVWPLTIVAQGSTICPMCPALPPFSTPTGSNMPFTETLNEKRSVKILMVFLTRIPDDADGWLT